MGIGIYFDSKFQSTPPRGWRPSTFWCSSHPGIISIHSTTRVETRRCRKNCLIGNNFNPLHHEGGDGFKNCNIISHGNFNPLHHEGGDENCIPVSQIFLYFNPLHHEGGDPSSHRRFLKHSKFQSTPPRGWRP